MRDFRLSERMEAVVKLVSPQSFAIADIGCDHAYVSIALAKQNRNRKVIAMDVRTGPLEIARSNVEQSGLSGQIAIRLSDGLDELETGEVDTIVIAGMGGLLMKSILERGMHILEGTVKRPVLILQPQSDIREIRIFLYEHAYHIVQEIMLCEEGKYYTIIKAFPGVIEEKGYTEAEWLYGRYCLQAKDAVLREYLVKEHNNLVQIKEKLDTIHDREDAAKIPEKTKKRYIEVKQALFINETALQCYTFENTRSEEKGVLL